jgi:competence protein ComEA
MKLFKQFGLMIVLFFAALQLAFAIDVNTADAASLDSVKDIGPKTAAKIIEERGKNGPFKDWDDLITRVKGIGPKNSDTMSAGGLTVNGKAKANAPAAAPAAPKAAAPAPAPSAAKAKAGSAKSESSAEATSGTKAAGDTGDAKKPAHKKRSKKDKTKSGDANKDAAKAADAAKDKDAGKPAEPEAGKTGK